MKVYIVNRAIGDDGHSVMIGIFTTEKKAIEVMNKHQFKVEQWWDKKEVDGVTIEEWELDKDEMEEIF